MDALIYAVLGMVLLVIIVTVCSWPIKVLVKLIANGILGVILLLLTNFIGERFFHFTLGINVVTALIAGFFGIPGVVFLIIFKLLL